MEAASVWLDSYGYCLASEGFVPGLRQDALFRPVFAACTHCKAITYAKIGTSG